MPKIHFNMTNWTGGYSHVDILNDEGKFKIDQYPDWLFWLERINADMAVIKCNEHSEPLGTLYCNNHLEPITYTAVGNEIARTHKNPFVAAAQLICNIV